jgi:fructuronate reductase
MSKRLSLSNYQELPDNVARPKYDMAAHKAGIVHIGIGAFHRGHQAVFTDDAIANSGGNWRIIGVSLRSESVSEQMNPQDGLYTVTAKSKQQQETRLIGAIEKVIVAPQNPAEVLALLASSDIKVLTLTVTEKGYHYNMASHALAEENADIKHDIAHPTSPISMPGYIVAACAMRMNKAKGNYKLSIISCDNLPENGEVTRKVVCDLAAKISPELLTWIETNVSFSSSMVDRIVPAVTEQNKESMRTKLGMRDEAMIETEIFKQWVVEDSFCTSTPDWKSAGVLIVDKVESYEKLKLRTLNGSHSALAYMGVLLGYEWIHQAIADPLLLNAIQRLMKQETGPSLIAPSALDLPVYQRAIIERFQNDEIAYATQQVAMDGSQKMIQRIFAPIADNITNGKDDSSYRVMLAVVAAWMLYLRGKDEAGNTFEIKDPLADKLHSIALKNEHDPTTYVLSLISDCDVVPVVLSQNELFRTALINTLTLIQKNGLRAYLLDLLKV